MVPFKNDYTIPESILEYSVISTEEMDINDCRAIKEYIRKQFNAVLNANGWSDCEDSTSALSTERRHFTQGNATEFSIDVAIVAEGRNQWYRLIHEKTGFAAYDRYYWNEAPSSEGLSARVAKLKQTHLVHLKICLVYSQVETVHTVQHLLLKLLQQQKLLQLTLMNTLDTIT